MLNDKLKSLRDFVQGRGFSKFRSLTYGDFRKEFYNKKYNFSRRNAEILKFMCSAESPLVFSGEKIAFARTKKNVPYYFDSNLIKTEFLAKNGQIYDVYHNLTPNYEILLKYGLINRLKYVKEKNQYGNNSFYNDIAISIESVIELVDRYIKAEEEAGNIDTANVLRQVPKYPARTFHEALQSIRFVFGCFYLSDAYQIGFGRMDQYLFPYYYNDLKNGVITKQDAYDLLAEFFISLNKDSDLYRGVQQGDNGQSVMLGGCKSDGSCGINDLTYMIMEVSRDLKLIDPKINLRIDSKTPEDLIKLGCELTAVGLGFPQYSNDEVVIPALVNKGYDIEDARNYTVASCWEFIIPGKGIDIVNQGAVSFPYAVDSSFTSLLKNNNFSLKSLRLRIKESIKDQIKNILERRSFRTLPSPFLSVFMDTSLEQGKDAIYSAKYHNIGIHGAGSSNAADALATIKIIFETEGIAGLKKLEQEKELNFPDKEYLSRLNAMPKVGNDDSFVDTELKFLFDAFAECAEELSSSETKIRPGSGSAMYYIWLVENPKRPWVIEPTVKSTVDGKLDGAPLSASLAPSHGVKVKGILSVFKSYSRINYKQIMNGGPVTVELTPSVFTSENGIEKLASLIKYFVHLGNQQLQLNVLDVKTLEDAIEHPERHKNLIVRVWGWSGYFCELAPEYQQHVINRHKYALS